MLLQRLEEDLVFLVWFCWDLGVKRRDGGSKDQFSDELGQTRPKFCPRAAFGGQVFVAFNQLGEEFTRRLPILRVAGGWSSRRQEGVEAGVNRWRQEPANRRGNRV